MKELADQIIKGRILFVSGDFLIASRLNTLLISRDNGKNWEKTYTFNGTGFFDKLKMNNYYLSRLFRFGVHHLTVDDSNAYGVIFNDKLGIIQNGKLKQLAQLPHSRPLSFEYYKNNFLFGEYRNNPERSSVSAYAYSKEGDLRSVLKFDTIRHIHGIYKDPYSDYLWISTGDTDEEAAVYRTDESFQNPEKILSGSQQTRTIKLLFDEKYIFFGADAPNEVNFIYRFNRETKEVKKLQQVGSSVFHGCKVGNWLFFSTAIEPSEINKTKYAEIWASPDGEVWKCILKFKKDILPMRYFQYGQVFFPNNPEGTASLWFSPFATEYGNWSFKLDIKKVERLFDKSIS